MSSLSSTADPEAALLQVGNRVPALPARGPVLLRIGPAGRTVAIVYGTCLLLALAYPQAITAWLDAFEPNPVVETARACAARLVAVSERLGIAPVSASLRDRGRDLTAKPI